jgi:hypothetical protein
MMQHLQILLEVLYFVFLKDGGLIRFCWILNVIGFLKKRRMKNTPVSIENLLCSITEILILVSYVIEKMCSFNKF